MPRLVITLAVLLSLCCGVSLAAEVDSVDVFISGEGGYHTYRIPALLATKGGALLAFCEGRKGSRGDAGDIDLLVKRSEDGGRTWSDAMVVWDHGGDTCGNPCPVLDRETGVIWMPLTWNAGDVHESKIEPGYGPKSRRVFLTHSKDDGRTWAEPVEITPDVKREEWSWYATGPGAGIQLTQGEHKGRLVVACDHKASAPDGKKTYHSHVIYSDDHGKTWRIGGSAPSDVVNECEVAELSDGRLLLNMRNYDRSKHARQLAVSPDGGATWTDLRFAPELIEPICQASMRRYDLPTDGALGRLLFANPASESSRVNMTIRVSRDDGDTWSEGRTVHAGPSAYSSLAVLPDGDVGLLFECGDAHAYETITFARLPVEWIEE